MQQTRHIRIKFGEKIAIAAFAGAVIGMLAANAANQINIAPMEKSFAHQAVGTSQAAPSQQVNHEAELEQQMAKADD